MSDDGVSENVFSIFAKIKDIGICAEATSKYTVTQSLGWTFLLKMTTSTSIMHCWKLVDLFLRKHMGGIIVGDYNIGYILRYNNRSLSDLLSKMYYFKITFREWKNIL